MKFIVIADTNNPYYYPDKKAYFVPAQTPSIDVMVTRQQGSSTGSVPIGYINLLGDALPFMDTVQNKDDLTNC